MGPLPGFGLIPGLPAGQIKSFAPHLFRAISRRFLNVSVKDAIFQHRWVRHITGVHTALVLYEYVELWEKLESVQLRPLEGDRFVWRWTPDGAYSASSAYHSFFLGMSSLLGLEKFGRPQHRRWLSYSSGLRCMASFGRHAHRRMRHGLQEFAACALCEQEDETVDHLLASCVYSRELWYRLLRPSGWDQLTPLPGSLLSSWWMDARCLVPKQLRRGFDSVVLLVSWRLWRERNARIFDNNYISADQATRAVLDEGDDWITSGFTAFSEFLVVAASGR
jgi:hypothetical protein